MQRVLEPLETLFFFHSMDPILLGQRFDELAFKPTKPAPATGPAKVPADILLKWGAEKKADQTREDRDYGKREWLKSVFDLEGGRIVLKKGQSNGFGDSEMICISSISRRWAQECGEL